MTTPEPIYRYRAVKPFEEEQSMLFFGRKAETEQLAALIFSEKLTVLYGKSGYGKSSLLNAGILPRLKSENEKGQKRFVPVPIRFQNSEAGGESLMEKFRFHFSQAVKKQGIAAAAPPENIALPETLWGLFKTLQPTFGSPSGAGGTVFVLLFDQFEEFFSYPTAQQDEFKTQLSELLYTAYPNFVRENRKNLSDAELDFLSRDLDLRAVFAIRSDRLSDLDRLSRPLAAILKNRMELGALSESQAEEAILRPAALPNDGGIFKTEKFSFSDEALRRIKSALVGKDSKRIESFVLQIVCFSIEKTAERLCLAEIGTENLPDFNELFDNYYREQLSELPETDRAAAAHLLEFELLGYNPQTGTAHRRSVDSADLAAPPVLLEALERSYLIRREVNSFGRFSYEISHDTLVEPVLKARKIKDAAEADRKKRAELAAETERIAREKAEAERRGRRALVTAVVAGVLILGAVGASVFAFFQSKNAAAAIALAKGKTRDAEVSDSLATVKTRAAEVSDSIANLEKANAQTATGRATAAQKLADEKTKIAEAAQKKAQDASRQSGIDSENARLAKAEAEQKRQEAYEAMRLADEALTKLKLEKDSKTPFFLKALKTWEDANNYDLQGDEWKTKVDSLNFAGEDLGGLPDQVYECDNLRALDLSLNPNLALGDVLQKLGRLKNLNALYLGITKLTELPEQIGELKNLKTLDLVHNELTMLPNRIGELENLTTLGLSQNSGLNFEKALVQISELKNLTTLDLSYNFLTTLPAQIGGLENLTTLYLSNNRLPGLPVQIGELKNLTALYLKANEIKVLPAQIGGLKKLTTLDLFHNQLTELPAQIGGLKNLTTLDLGTNDLKEFPAQIGDLKKLVFLDLSHNKLTVLPPRIGELKNLATLDLSRNKLKALPAQIGELKNLATLDLSDNEYLNFEKALVQIAGLENLDTLDLSYNALATLPEQIGGLKNLKYLDLTRNELAELPPEIGELKDLKSLYLESNQNLNIEKTLAQISGLKKLTTLNLSYIHSWNFEKALAKIGTFKNLTTLYLRGSYIGESEQEKIKKLLPPGCEVFF